MNQKDTYYFSHDSNALIDQKILAMRCDYGLEGYGLYWAIIEMMRNESNYKLSLNRNTYRSITMLTGTTIDVEKYINDCINEYKGENGNGLFNANDKEFWSESFLLRMKKYEELKEKRKAAGLKGLQKRWGTKEEPKNEKKKLKLNKNIAIANKYYSKCHSKAIANAIKNGSIAIAKNSKLNQIKLNKIKLKEMKSIYPSTNSKKQNENNSFDDEMDEMRYNNIISRLGLTCYSPSLCVELQDILKEMYIDNKTKEKVETITPQNIAYALQNFAIANTKQKIQKPKSYFKKCILSAIEQTELSQQFDLNTIYENMNT